MTGKHLFELNAGKGNMDNISDIANAMERLAGGENAKSQEEQEKENKEQEESKRHNDNKEKAMNITHKHFMLLLFDVLTEFVKDLKSETLDVCVNEVMNNIPLTSKLTHDQFKNDVFEQIYAKINDILFAPYCDPQDLTGAEDSETDFDSDNESSKTISISNQASVDETDNEKQNYLYSYRNNVTSRLVKHFELVDYSKYNKKFESEINNLVVFKDEQEAEKYKGMLKDMIETLKDYLETQYSQSIFIDCVDLTFTSYTNTFSDAFKQEYQDDQKVFIGKILSLIYRLRNTYSNNYVSIEAKEPEKDAKKEEVKDEEPKVVEIDENEDENDENKQQSEQPKDTDENKEDIQDNPDLTSQESLQKSFRMFIKLVLTEGIENEQNMLDMPFNINEDGAGVEQLLQSLVG